MRGALGTAGRADRGLQAELQFRLPTSQTLAGGGLQRFELQVIVGRPDVLDRARTAASRARSAPPEPQTQSSPCADPPRQRRLRDPLSAQNQPTLTANPEVRPPHVFKIHNLIKVRPHGTYSNGPGVHPVHKTKSTPSSIREVAPAAPANSDHVDLRCLKRIITFDGTCATA